MKSNENCSSFFREDIKRFQNFIHVYCQRARADNPQIIHCKNGGTGGHLGLPTVMVLAIFNLEVVLLLQCMFQHKSPNGSEV